MALFLRKARALFGAAAVGAAMSACYNAGGGSDPPLKSLYFPVGMSVSPDGQWLVVINSDFDLQYNGGTLQTYNLQGIRTDALNTIAGAGGCATEPAPNGLLGLACARPLDAGPGVYWQDPIAYWKDGVVVGAFATDLLQLSFPGWQNAMPDTTRLFAPTRGTTAVLFANLALGDAGLSCAGEDEQHRCGVAANVGSDPNALHDTRNVVLSGEPFGIAQVDDGTAFVVTSESDTTTSVFTSGISVQPSTDGGEPPLPVIPPVNDPSAPTLEYVLGGLPAAGTGIAEIPHDPKAWPTCGPSQALGCVRPAFLETNHSTAEIDLLRYYSDDGSGELLGAGRPFLQREGVFPLTATTGSDARGIVIDDSARSICRTNAAQSGTDDTSCGYLPASVFIASRTPPGLLLGQVGNGGSPDALSIQGTVPLPAGPSKVYRAPVIDAHGNFSLRIFVACFDSNIVVVYDPATQLWDTIHVGSGPFAMAFDPFPESCWGQNRNTCPVQPSGLNPQSYRFAYVASFTQSFIEVIDLDNSQSAVPSTYESIVYAVGQPTLPKGQ